MLHLAANGAYTYELNNATAQSLAAGQSVTDTFGYAATDGITFTPGELRVSIAGTNDAPVAKNDAAAASEDGATVVSGNVLGNDLDRDPTQYSRWRTGEFTSGSTARSLWAPMAATAITLNNAQHGASPTASLTEVFSYVASDGIAPTAGTLTVFITGANDARPATMRLRCRRTACLAQGNVLANDTDIDAGTILTVVPRHLYRHLRHADPGRGRGVQLFPGQCVHGGAIAGADQAAIDGFVYGRATASSAA